MGTAINLVVLSQSLVVARYRSFYTHLAQACSWDISLISPSSFKELGFQQVDCEPVEDNPGFRFHSLDGIAPHIQALILPGLLGVLKRSFSKGSHNVFVCMAEPYSVTALYAYFMAKLTAKKFTFITYAAQNIDKSYPTPLRMIEKFILKRSDGVWCIGREQEEILKRRGFQNHILKLPLWYDSAVFRPLDRQKAKEELGLREDFSENRITIGFAGALVAEKGVFDLLSCLKNHFAPSDPLTILIAGGGSGCNEAKRQSEELKSLGFDIHFLGPVASSKMPQYFSLIDLFVVPSKSTPGWKEQFGRVIVEAMACGSIVVGSDSGAIPEVIDDESKIFGEGNIAEIATVIKRWAEKLRTQDSALKSQMVQKAEPYSDRALARRFIEKIKAFKNQ
jgi:glycosyltransferase involved in cell wall biosynthesis